MDAPVFHLERVVRARTEGLEDFTGPLDLILHLLDKNKIEIKDIQISLLLDQYMSWIAKRKELDLEVASAFVIMAAHLVYIKTRMLLSLNDEEAMSEMEELIASLEERRREETYSRIKATTPAFADFFVRGQAYFTKSMELLPLDHSYRYVHAREDLRTAMLAVLMRVGFELPPPLTAFEGIVGREPYPVADKAAEVLQYLLCFGVTRLLVLLREGRSRSEVVATFLAVLELCKANQISVLGTGEDCVLSSVTPEERKNAEILNADDADGFGGAIEGAYDGVTGN